ncbi:hypothetical protein PT277_03965 [Acetobacteraceae bacterium ESL0709]|nr:hypothetical protein [Acetobacteraceae bacterium ESL0697]MDF7677854.1 hypothetical protein [Acetobacteraceae bacterium ESL0709]
MGQETSGWQPYGPWSHLSGTVADELILAPGVAVTLPSGKGEKLDIGAAINPMRELIFSTHKAVRITGLSGVGKTRIVQALFDDRLGEKPLDRTIAIYTDISNGPFPSATAMLEQLIAEGERAVLVIDNCAPDLHSSLVKKLPKSGDDIKLITVEYDLREDKPEATEVIYIEAIGRELAEKLLHNRFPAIGDYNARRIAELSGGNARVSLAIAERVEAGEDLTQLSDAQLFNRLFDQRNQPNDSLREQAEILSLVYSVSISESEAGQSELDILGSIGDYTRKQLLRAIKTLSDRQIVQKRADWRAILPQVIANKLADSALITFSAETLRKTFEAPGCERLLMSFAHRLGFLHDSSVAKDIVQAWLQPEGLMTKLVLSNDIKGPRILEYIASVSPDAILKWIEIQSVRSASVQTDLYNSSYRAAILNCLQLIAYEAGYFDHCVKLLIGMSDHESERSSNNDEARARVIKFFQASLSGTHASLGQRLAVMNKCFSSDISHCKSLAFEMLRTALKHGGWIGSWVNEFGARSRDFGFQPTPDDLVAWYNAFIDAAVRLGNSDALDLARNARATLAKRFRGLWHFSGIRDKLVEAARQLHVHRPWGEGWKAVRFTIYFDYKKSYPIVLSALEKELRPKDLVSEIMTFIFGNGHHPEALDIESNFNDSRNYELSNERRREKAIQLGEKFAASTHRLEELGQNLFSAQSYTPYRYPFGRGLAKGSHDLRALWQDLLEQLKPYPGRDKDFDIFAGFIAEAKSIDPILVEEFLDDCVHHAELRHVIVVLYSERGFTENDFQRCMVVLDDSDISARNYQPIIWRKEYAHLPAGLLIKLAQQLLTKPGGADVVLEALSLKLHGRAQDIDTLGAEWRQIGLQAAIQRIQENRVDDDIDYHMEHVIGAALRFDSNDDEKTEWLDALFSLIERDYGCFFSFKETIATTVSLVPEEFLNRVFSGDEEQQSYYLFFMHNKGLKVSPLERANIDRLIAWCRHRKEPDIWASIAGGIDLWPNDHNQSEGEMPLLERAVKFLKASPDPQAVLDAFIGRLMPRSWWGSQAEMMQIRADALNVLCEDEDRNIAAAAKLWTVELAERIKCIRLTEQERNARDEQRFE